MGQPACLEKMTLVWERGHPQRKRISKAFTGPLSPRFDHKDILKLNKFLVGPFKTLSFETPVDIA